MSTLPRALAGRYDEWWWEPGLTPEAVRAELDTLTYGEGVYRGAVVPMGGATVPEQPYEVLLRWSPDRELALVQIAEPAMPTPWPELRAALGEPDAVHRPGSGALPGATQWCHYDRGLTVFETGLLGIQAIWLYRPTTDDEYGELTGAFDRVRRHRR